MLAHLKIYVHYFCPDRFDCSPHINITTFSDPLPSCYSLQQQKSEEKLKKFTRAPEAQKCLRVRAIISFHSLLLWSNYYDNTIIMIAP